MPAWHSRLRATPPCGFAKLTDGVLIEHGPRNTRLAQWRGAFFPPQALVAGPSNGKLHFVGEGMLAMTGLKAREPRLSTCFAAQMRADGAWKEVTVGNVSRRGLMVRCQEPPARGTVVEIRCRDVSVVGRIIWSSVDRCGLCSRDPIEHDAVLGLRPPKPAPLRPSLQSTTRSLRPVVRAEAKLETSKRHAAFADWFTIAAIGAAFALLIADLVTKTLETAFTPLVVAMGKSHVAKSAAKSE